LAGRFQSDKGARQIDVQVILSSSANQVKVDPNYYAGATSRLKIKAVLNLSVKINEIHRF